MPKFEANMNYIPPSPPSSMKQCKKSATVKFHMELLLTTTTRKQSRSGATPIEQYNSYRYFQLKKNKESVAIIDALILFIFIHCC